MIRAAFLLAVLMMPVAACANEWSCDDRSILPQQGLNMCALLDFEQADAELNRAWQTVFPKLKARDKDINEQWQGLPDAVLKAQRSWIAYRDTHCSAEGFRYRGGSIEPLIYHACRATLTRARTQQINEYLEN